MSTETIYYLLVAIVIFGFVLDQVLDYLNYRHKKSELPKELKGIYSEEEYKKSVAYQKEVQQFSFFTETLSFILIIVMLTTGGFGWLDEQLRSFTENLILLALAYFAVLFIASDLLSLPFQWYSTFVIEEKWGFNKTTPKLFMLDKLKGYLLSVILGGGIMAILLYLIISIGQEFWLYFWGITALIMLLANMFYTSLIVPLFNKLTPLDEGELKDAIKAYSNKVNFPLENIYVIDGSKRSSKANAFFSGLGKKKKIVLYDTLIEKHTTEELVAVLAHEAGHYKKKHVITGFILSLLQTGLMLFIMSRMIFSEELSFALGAEDMGIHLNLLVFGILFSPLSMVTGLVMNVLSRKNEYEADAFAAETYRSEALQEALKKLSVSNLSNLLPHPWYVFFHYSHPPLLQRLEALKKY